MAAATAMATVSVWRRRRTSDETRRDETRRDERRRRLRRRRQTNSATSPFARSLAYYARQIRCIVLESVFTRIAAVFGCCRASFCSLATAATVAAATVAAAAAIVCCHDCARARRRLLSVARNSCDGSLRSRRFSSPLVVAALVDKGRILQAKSARALKKTTAAYSRDRCLSSAAIGGARCRSVERQNFRFLIAIATVAFTFAVVCVRVVVIDRTRTKSCLSAPTKRAEAIASSRYSKNKKIAR